MYHSVTQKKEINFGLIYTESVCMEQIMSIIKMYIINRVETMEKKKCGLPAFSPFFCDVFKIAVPQDRLKLGLCGRGLACAHNGRKKLYIKYISHLTHSHTMTPFDAPGKQAF